MVGVCLQLVTTEVDSTAGDRVQNRHADKHDDSQHEDQVITLVGEERRALAQIGHSRHCAVVALPEVDQLKTRNVDSTAAIGADSTGATGNFAPLRTEEPGQTSPLPRYLSEAYFDF